MITANTAQYRPITQAKLKKILILKKIRAQILLYYLMLRLCALLCGYCSTFDVNMSCCYKTHCEHNPYLFDIVIINYVLIREPYCATNRVCFSYSTESYTKNYVPSAALYEAETWTTGCRQANEDLNENAE